MEKNIFFWDETRKHEKNHKRQTRIDVFCLFCKEKKIFFVLFLFLLFVLVMVSLVVLARGEECLFFVVLFCVFFLCVCCFLYVRYLFFVWMSCVHARQSVFVNCICGELFILTVKLIYTQTRLTITIIEF